MYQESNEGNKRSQDGWYRHKETGALVQLIDDPTYGVPLTNAYIKAGYQFVGKEKPADDGVKEVSKETAKK